MGEQTIAPETVDGGGGLETSEGLDEALWNPVAAAVLLRTRPQFDELVLDVCAGTGSTAVPTAELVGIGGLVDAVERDESLAAVARERAGDRLPQLRFHTADASEWDTMGYDLVQCAHGVPFDDAGAAAGHLVSRLKPGGRFAVALWSRDAFAPLPEILERVLAEAVGTGEVPDASDGTADADEAQPEASAPLSLDTPGTLARWLHDLGLVDVRAEIAPRHLELDGDLAWTLVRGRAWHTPLVDAGGDPLDDGALDDLRVRYLAAVAASGATRVDASAVIGVGRLPG
ncbi:class I SAM-dependent methyltransferase [Agromyces protaetiae]|nr:class I SAM-dependent methyltransferase [Agromyces protaetiae]